MQKKGKPIYRRGRKRCREINTCLSLLDQYHSGCIRDPRLKMVIRDMDRQLSGIELDYLRMYYGDALNLCQIGRLRSRSPSTISRSLVRAEGKVEQIIDYGRSFWGEDFL